MSESYLTFRRAPELEKPNGKTLVWGVYNTRSGDLLGTIAWLARWRQYIFDPWQSMFSAGCMREIADFLDTHRLDRR